MGSGSLNLGSSPTYNNLYLVQIGRKKKVNLNSSSILKMIEISSKIGLDQTNRAQVLLRILTCLNPNAPVNMRKGGSQARSPLRIEHWAGPDPTEC